MVVGAVEMGRKRCTGHFYCAYIYVCVSILISLYAMYISHNNKFKRQNKRKKTIPQMCLCGFNKRQGKVIGSLKTSSKYLDHTNKKYITFFSNQTMLELSHRERLTQICHSLEQCDEWLLSFDLSFKFLFIYSVIY